MTSQTGLVLLHGWGMNSAVWEALPEGLGAGRGRYPIDLPGHGGQPFDRAQTSLPAWADACLARAPERAVWVGWSLGGLVALQAARQAPARVAALVLITATPRFVQAVDWRAAMPARTLVQFHDGLLADPAGTLERFLALQVRGSDLARATLRHLRAELAARPPADPAALAAGLDLLAEGDLRGPLPDIAAPTLWLFGQRDLLVPAAVGERIALLMPESRQRVIVGSAHAPHLSHVSETVAAIDGFLHEVGV